MSKNVDVTPEQFAKLIDSICGEIQLQEFMHIFKGEKKCQSKK